MSFGCLTELNSMCFFFQAKKSGRYDQGILDVGLTAEDKVELVKTHTFMRKHATGKCKIELHVLHVERGDFYFSFFFFIY